MRTRSRNPIGRFQASGKRSAGTGVLLLSLVLVSAPSFAAAPATAVSTKKDTTKAAPSKVVSTQAAPSKTRSATATAVSKPVKRTGPPPSRLATMPTMKPTRATGMRKPSEVRAALARKAAPARTAPLAKAVEKPGAKTASSATPAPVATATPSRATATTQRPVPTGIPMGPNAGSKLATGKPSSNRIVPATARGVAIISPAPKGVAQTKATVSTTTKTAPEAPKPTTTLAGKGSVTPIAKTKATKAPTVSPVKTAPVVTPLPFEDQVAYQYNALGRRDPFTSLLEGEFIGMDVGGDAPPDVGGLKVVGIVWGSDDQFAMVEDIKGNSYVLRRGDKVMNGFVEGLKRDAMIVNITVDGQSQSVSIPITRKGDKSNANR